MVIPNLVIILILAAGPAVELDVVPKPHQMTADTQG